MADGNAGDDGLEQRFLSIEPMDFQEEELATSSSSIKETRFDLIIGHIEDIIMEEEFQAIQNDFMERYYMEFEDTEENKFIYTDIHKEYCDLIERYLERELAERIEHFNMHDFVQQLEEFREELDGEIFDILLTFSDFVAFKEMFLDYRASKENRVVDLSLGITVTPLGQLDCLTINSNFPPNQRQGGGDDENEFL